MSLYPDWTVDRGVYPRWLSVVTAVKRFSERIRLASGITRIVNLVSRLK